MNRVFGLEPCRHLTQEGVKEWGELVHLFTQDGERSSIWQPEFAPQVVAKLELLRFDPVTDFFVVAGGNVANYVAGTAVISRFGAFRSICYNATKQTYQVVEVKPQNPKVK